ncbi:uncharacterized protein LOC134607981 [Pelobates fuscus]|uniref:uncharacterized protein LOC134607981 n=1 Tax=Pelobates fuscus TaxID=191477 RepID=UPI002FE440F5
MESSSTNTSTPLFWCNICRVSCLSALNLHMHFMGAKHKKVEESLKNCGGEQLWPFSVDNISSGKESKEKPNDDQTEPCPSERSLGEGNKHSAVTYSKAEVFAFLRNFEVADKSDVTFIKTVTLLFSKALRKFQGKDLEDKECFGAEPESSVDEEDLKSPRTYSGSRSVSISIQPLHTSSHKQKAKHRRRKTYSHSSSRSPSSEHVRSTSRSSLQITIKSANVGENSNIKEELGEIVLSENDNTETLEVIDTLEENCTSNPDLEDKDDHFEMDQSVENGNPECLTAEAASSDDEDV